ncbi:AAA family ATPase [Burkholderia contaminans]|uniref:AAA family ATPase n=1 Tax=Burkholderia contaminans TaxID=488447 RepID=UPI002653B3BF|nr:ATP-binding protein [Burkholderia contaminans]MDN7790485.1 AAA family ATPase [Burkholderia contaminans]
MYIRRFVVENVRSISKAEMTFDKGKEAGWHVVLGSNGSGKSSLVRSFSLLAMGEKEAYASRQDFSRWISSGVQEAMVSGAFTMDPDYDVLSGKGQVPSRLITAAVVIYNTDDSYSRSAETAFGGQRVQRTLWGGGQGWFTASFGPFRRFTGGDRIYDRLFLSNKRLAPHLTALGEDVALTEAMAWMTSLYVRSLHDSKNKIPSEAQTILDLVVNFINESAFLPHGAWISEVKDDSVHITDGNGCVVPLDQLSDGYRSALSLVIELIRQMFELYGIGKMEFAMTIEPGTVQAPGVVAIDEVDAHLHPTWQRDIGRWLTRCFPRVQFIVTTHSPIICRAVADGEGYVRGSIWKLPVPGTDEKFRRVEDLELHQLVYGDVLDAFSTELFGAGLTRSKVADQLLDRLAELNLQALERELSSDEQNERRSLRKIFPAAAGDISE